jgi:DNA-binding MarR family transcriptional regulator
MSFGRSRALRRLAQRPMTMSELAAAAEMDAPYTTVVVDDLEARGLVRRRPHPTDRRAKLVEATPRGKTLARRADSILATPPPALGALASGELETLLRILSDITAHAHRSASLGEDEGPKSDDEGSSDETSVSMDC